MAQVSVVIPTYNRPALLERAIKSVLAQTFTDFELLVVQNGGRDDALSVVEKFKGNDGRVKYLYSDMACASTARNYGAHAAQGQYIAFLDDDDEWLPEKLEKQISFLDGNPDVALATCQGRRVNEKGKVLGQIHAERKAINYATLLKEGCQIVTLSSVVVRKTSFEAAGGFDPKYAIANDYDFYLRLAKEARIEMVAEELFHYHWHPLRASWDIQKMYHETTVIARGHAKGSSVTSHSIMRSARIRAARYYYFLAVESVDLRQYGDAARYYFSAVVSDPLVGVRSVSWGRRNNVWYRGLRPYAGAVYFWIRGSLQLLKFW